MINRKTFQLVNRRILKSKRSKSQKGFTLIELLLYITLSGMVLSAISFFLYLVVQSRVKNQSIAEVEQQGTQIIQLISQTIRNSEAINSPMQGTSSQTLSLDVPDLNKDPTVFDISGDDIRVTEGVSAPIILTSSRITASSLSFQNLSRSNTPGNIRTQFTLTHINPAGRNEFDYSKIFYNSISIR